jgi:hypothetical protein
MLSVDWQGSCLPLRRRRDTCFPPQAGKPGLLFGRGSLLTPRPPLACSRFAESHRAGRGRAFSVHRT